MSWNDSHRYYQALRTVEAELDRTADGRLPWSAEYEAVFGTREQLLAALHTRWLRMLHAQVELGWDCFGQLTPEYRTLVARHAGLLRALTAHGIDAFGTHGGILQDVA